MCGGSDKSHLFGIPLTESHPDGCFWLTVGMTCWSWLAYEAMRAPSFTTEVWVLVQRHMERLKGWWETLRQPSPEPGRAAMLPRDPCPQGAP